MNVIIVGCGRVGATLAYLLSKKGHRVTVIDQMASAFTNLPSDFVGRTIEGEVLNQGVLHRAGIEQTDAVVAVTTSDSLNAVVCHAARTIYRVPRVIARNYDPAWLPLFEAFGLQSVSSALWAAQHIEEMLASTMTSVLSTGHGEVEVYEMAVPHSWVGKRVSEVLAANSIAVSLTRAGKAVLPTPTTVLEEGDMMHVSATLEGATELQAQLQKAEPKPSA
jgi:trk system potassium uptake protein TrkA